jgi:hypothetical protein
MLFVGTLSRAEVEGYGLNRDQVGIAWFDIDSQKGFSLSAKMVSGHPVRLIAKLGRFLRDLEKQPYPSASVRVNLMDKYAKRLTSARDDQ